MTQPTPIRRVPGHRPLLLDLFRTAIRPLEAAA